MNFLLSVACLLDHHQRGRVFVLESPGKPDFISCIATANGFARSTNFSPGLWLYI